MNGSSIWAIVALLVAALVAVATLLSEKKEREINPPRFRRWRKPILYSLTGAALVVGVVQILNADREACDAEKKSRQANDALKDALAKLDESTTQIANMTALNTQLQRSLIAQSDTIADLSRQNIAAVTGGNSFCYVIASPVEQSFMLAVSTVGSSPLHDVGVEMIDVDLLRTMTNKPSLTMQELQSFRTVFPSIPSLSSSSGHWVATIPTGGRDKRNLHFNFFSMNGVWGEDLNLRFVKGQWQQALRVMKQLKNNKQKMIYSMVPPDYPTVDGKVDW
jgi:hypothetical protein